MNPKIKKIIRKIVYGILFGSMIFAFIFLSEKYASNSEVKEITIADYYTDLTSNKFTILRGYEFISHVKKNKNIVLIGSSSSIYSQKYVAEIDEIISEIEAINSIYYYDLANDKNQNNASYYEIKELLSGSLVTTDGTQNNLLAPSFYIIDKGKVLYYNIETVAMKNTDKVSDYWTEEKERTFKDEIIRAINKYYLN